MLVEDGYRSVHISIELGTASAIQIHMEIPMISHLTAGAPDLARVVLGFMNTADPFFRQTNFLTIIID
jgi:hypothetical protein